MPKEERKNLKSVSFLHEFDGFQLKLIGAITMFCSHVYKCLLMEYKALFFLDIIGRIAFPIFCFLLVEGFCHSHSRKAYVMRLWVCAIFSEIPFDMAFYGKIYTPAGQNVLFTMLIGMLVLVVMEKCRGWIQVVPVALGMAVAWCCRVDYGFYGIWLIVVFYVLRGMKKEMLSLQAGNCLASVGLFGWKQFFSVLAFPFIVLYNGQKGKGWKYFFYVFYPLHLMLLVSIRALG